MEGKLVILILGLAIGSILAPFAAADEVARMTKEQLKALLNDPDMVILDVRTRRDWKENEKKIKGAIRENPKDKTLGLYCA